MMLKEKKEESVETQQLTQRDYPQLYNLLKLCFPGYDPMVFEWRYRKYSGLKPEDTIVVKKNRTLTSAVTVWPMKIDIGPNHILDVFIAGEGATHPDFRKRGVYSQCMDKALAWSKEKGAGLVLGHVTTANVNYKILRKLGWCELLTQHFFIKVLDYAEFFRRIVRSRVLEKAESFSKLSERLRDYEENILIVPDRSDPFTLVIQKGEIEILKQVKKNPILTLKGDIGAAIFAKNFTSLFAAIVTRRVKVKVSIRRIRRAFRIAMILRSLL